MQQGNNVYGKARLEEYLANVISKIKEQANRLGFEFVMRKHRDGKRSIMVRPIPEVAEAMKGSLSSSYHITAEFTDGPYNMGFKDVASLVILNSIYQFLNLIDHAMMDSETIEDWARKQAGEDEKIVMN